MLAKKASNLSFSNDFVGTPPYMAPEMLTNIFPYGKPADWYCLGVLLYEFLHGEPPFSAATEDEIVNNMMTGNLILSESISTEARNLIGSLF